MDANTKLNGDPRGSMDKDEDKKSDTPTMPPAFGECTAMHTPRKIVLSSFVKVHNDDGTTTYHGKSENIRPGRGGTSTRLAVTISGDGKVKKISTTRIRRDERSKSREENVTRWDAANPTVVELKRSWFADMQYADYAGLSEGASRDIVKLSQAIDQQAVLAAYTVTPDSMANDFLVSYLPVEFGLRNS